MQVTGTVTKRRKTVTKHGSGYLSLTLRTENGQESTLKFLWTAKPVPNIGDTVTVSGVPMVGYKHVNVGAATITYPSKGE